MNTQDALFKSEQVFICSYDVSVNKYWILPYKNGLKVAQIVTHLIEDIFPNTNLQVVVLSSIDSIGDNIEWLFSSSEEYFDYLVAVAERNQI